jgi:hypothetical protein
LVSIIIVAKPASADVATKLFGRRLLPNVWNSNGVTEAERFDDIAEKLFRWRYLSLYPDAEHDMVWLFEKLNERNVRIAELEARLRRNEWIFLLP